MNWHDCWPRCPCTEISYSLSILPCKQNNAKIWFNLSNLCASPKPNLRKLRLEAISACSRGITWCNMVSVYIAYRTIQPFSSFSQLLVAPTCASGTLRAETHLRHVMAGGFDWWKSQLEAAGKVADNDSVLPRRCGQTSNKVAKVAKESQRIFASGKLRKRT